MKVLITGSSGFVGGHLVSLVGGSHTVVPFDLKEGLDVRKSEMLNNKTKSIDAIVHLAALVVGPESWDKPWDYLETNGVGTFNVITSAIKNKVKRVIIVSSAAIYGAPLNPYGASKLWAEAVTQTYKDQIETFVVRPFNIYGSGQNPAYGYAIHNFARAIKETGVVDIFGDGEQTRDFISVGDVCKTLNALLTAEKVISNPIDLGTGKQITINNLAKLEATILGKSYKVSYKTKRQEPYISVANTANLKELGINPNNFMSLEDGLRGLILQ